MKPKRIESRPMDPEMVVVMELPKKAHRYPLTFSFEFEAGKEEIKVVGRPPEVTIRIEHIASNVREPDVAQLRNLNAANVMCVLGDYLDLCALPEGDDPILGVPVSFPWITPSNRLDLTVRYTGKLPQGVKKGEKIDFV